MIVIPRLYFYKLFSVLLYMGEITMQLSHLFCFSAAVPAAAQKIIVLLCQYTSGKKLNLSCAVKGVA